MAKERDSSQLLEILKRSGRPPRPSPFFAARVAALAAPRPRLSLVDQLDGVARRLVPLLAAASLVVLFSGLWLTTRGQSESLEILSGGAYPEQFSAEMASDTWVLLRGEGPNK